MLVEPSGFRTDWAGRSANESKRHIADYAATAGAWRKQVRAISGKQPGDPVRAAQAIVKAVESVKPPHHLFLATMLTKALRPSSKPCTRSSLRGKRFRVEPISRRVCDDRRLELSPCVHEQLRIDQLTVKPNQC